MAKGIVEKRFDDLLKILENNKISSDIIKLITKAFLFASKKHEGQLRKSGEPFIIHPLETAINLATWNVDYQCIITGLLHDTIEDTQTTEKEILSNFGKEVYKLIDYVTSVAEYGNKIRHKEIDNNKEYFYLRKIYLSIAEDSRAFIVKLADRLHNMRTIDFLPPHKQVSNAKETMEIYAEIAGFFGMYDVKSELQNISFRILMPIEYNNIDEQVKPIVENGKKTMNEIIKKISDVLNMNKVAHTIEYRVKTKYSIYNKIQTGLKINEIRDIFAVRIIVDKLMNCYDVLGYIHTNFSYTRNNFRDYIAQPKTNMYQSIHTTVSMKGMLLEFQVRTKEMDDIAKYGIAAHWRYKNYDPNFEFDFVYKLKDILNKKEGIVESVKGEILLKKVTVFIKGNQQSYQLAFGSTVLDLAFILSPKRALYLSSARIRNIDVAIFSVLQNNATVELLYNEKRTVNSRWIDFVTNIEFKRMISKVTERMDIEENKHKLLSIVGEINEKISVETIEKKLESLYMDNLDELYQFVTKFNVDPQIIKEIFLSKSQKKTEWAIKSMRMELTSWLNSKQYVTSSASNVLYNNVYMTKCCNKVPGQQIGGIIIDNRLYVHNINCKKANFNNFISLKWNERLLQEKPKMFRSIISIVHGMSDTLNNMILDNIMSFGAPIISMETKIEEGLNKKRMIVTLMIGSFEALQNVVDSVMLIKDTYEVNIVDNNTTSQQ
jgi:guanosine-3',5'-bis(diphosphate) 3'-pyrophosphohydrolase